MRQHRISVVLFFLFAFTSASSLWVNQAHAQADSAPVHFKRGDCNADGEVAGVTDGVFVLRYAFLGEAEPACFDACDTNDDAGLDISDAVFLFRFLFLGGRPLAAPGLDNCAVITPPLRPLNGR